MFEHSSLPESYSLLTNNSLTKDVTIFIGLIINGVLDASLLEKKATEFIARWPVLGGTLVTKSTPYSFTTGSIVDFKSRHIDTPLRDVMPIDFNITETDKPSYRKFSNGNSGDSLFHFESLRPLGLLPETLFALRVTVLQDATLLGFRMPHHLCDGQSAYDIVKNYCDLVSGRPIPEIILPPDVTIPLSTVVQGEDSLPQSVQKDAPFVDASENYALGASSLAKYVGYSLLQLAGAKIGLVEGEEERYIHLPKTLVERWRHECQKELEDAISRGDLIEGAGDIELTKNDIITAWFLKTAYTHTPPDDLPIDLMYSFNYRPALTPPPPKCFYIRCSFYTIRMHWSSLSEFQSSSLAEVALAIRLSVLRNKQPSAIRKTLEFWEKHSIDIVAPGPPGGRFSALPFFSPWTTFEYNGLDFSAALVGDDLGKGKGKVVFTHPYPTFPMGMTVKPFAISLKDGMGGYWLRSNLSESSWKGHGK